jgi:hypothetical protein
MEELPGRRISLGVWRLIAMGGSVEEVGGGRTAGRIGLLLGRGCEYTTEM